MLETFYSRKVRKGKLISVSISIHLDTSCEKRFHILTLDVRTGRDLAANSPLWGTRGPLWEGEVGLNVGRWGFWKTRFEVYAADQGLLKETQHLAQIAVRAMNDTDRKMI